MAAGPQAAVEVICRAADFDATVLLVRWVLGYPVWHDDAPPSAITRRLFVLTRLAYEGPVPLARFGLDVLERVDGVLSWTVVPLDRARHPVPVD
jgi:hypothetical protein